jgi:hypothetical protein
MSIQTTERYLGSEQEIAVAVNDSKRDDELMDDPGMPVRQGRNRRSATEKRLIVEQAYQPGASVVRVARVDWVER